MDQKVLVYQAETKAVAHPLRQTKAPVDQKILAHRAETKLVAHQLLQAVEAKEARGADGAQEVEKAVAEVVAEAEAMAEVVVLQGAVNTEVVFQH